MKIRFYILVLLVLFLNADSFSQTGTDNSPAAFVVHYDMASFKSGEDNAKVEFYYQISNQALTYVKSDSVFRANYELSLSVYDMDDNMILNRVFDKHYTVNSFKETTLKSQFWINQLNFFLEPGEYKVGVRFVDVESGKVSDSEKKLFIPSFSGPNLKISGIEFVGSISNMTIQEEFVKNKLNLLPNATITYGDLLPKLFFYYELYNIPMLLKKKHLKIEYRILDYLNEIVLILFDTIIYSSGHTTQVANIGIDNLQEGKYTLEIRVKPSDDSEFESQSKEFHVKRTLGWIGEDFDKSIRYLNMIASEKEVLEMMEADDLGKRKLWMEFWKRNDPSPGTETNELMEEFYRRIRYANKNYTHIKKEGWTADRGRTYIKYGRPDEIVRNFLYGANESIGIENLTGGHAASQRSRMRLENRVDSGKPSEIWYFYSAKKRFVFVDKHGTGDMRMVFEDEEWW